MHHFALPCRVAHEVRIRLRFFLRPFFRPRRITVFVDRVNNRELDILNRRDVSQYHVLRESVSDHQEAPAPHVQRPEERLLHPLRAFPYAFFVARHFVIIEVVDNDVIGPLRLLLQPTRRLPATDGKPLCAAGRGELASLPVACIFLCSEVGNQTLVVFELCLQVAE